MSRNVLLACDLSAENRAAFGRAIRLANESGARLYILHVVDPYLPKRLLHDLSAAVVDDIATMLTDLRESYALLEPPNLIQTVTGEPYVEIIREAYEREAELLVLGTHRKRGQPSLVEGTTLSRVMQHAPCPVVTACQPANLEWLDILVPVDFSLTSRHTLRQIIKRFPEARVTLLHAWQLPGEATLGSSDRVARWRDSELMRLRQLLERETETLMSELEDVPDLTLEIEQGEPLEVLLSRLRRQSPDLLALGNRGLLGRRSRITAALLSEPHCDLMLCRAW